MADDTPTVWVMRAGAHGEGHQRFIDGNCIAINSPALGDLLALDTTPDAFIAAHRKAYPGHQDGTYAFWGHEVFKFVHEMKNGDLVLYPAKVNGDRQVRLGRVEGLYEYSEAAQDEFSHVRRVSWLLTFSRNQVSPGAQQRLNQPPTFYRVNNEYAGEFIALLDGRNIAPGVDQRAPVTSPGSGRPDGEPVTYTSLQAHARRHVIKKLARELDPYELEKFIAHLLALEGYKSEVTPPGPDHGIDVLATKADMAVSLVLKVQVKSTEGNIGFETLCAFCGRLESHEFGMFVTLGGFTADARSYASDKKRLRLMDGQMLANEVIRVYDRLDARYKELLSL